MKSMSSSSLTYSSQGGNTSVSFLGADPEITRQTMNFNESNRRVLQNSASESSLLRTRKESERSVLTIAYRIRAEANATDMPLPGLVTSRKQAKLNARENIKQLKERNAIQRTRPKTASMLSRSRQGLRETQLMAQSRPMSATLSATRQSNQVESPSGQFMAPWPSVELTYERPKTASGVLTSDSEVRELVSTLNMNRMMSTLSVNSSTVGPEGIAVKVVKIKGNVLPDEPMAERVNFETTHLHKLRMGYLTGTGYAFDLDHVGSAKKRRPHTSSGRPPRPRWRYNGESPAWRPIKVEAVPLPMKINCTGAKYPWTTQYPA